MWFLYCCRRRFAKRRHPGEDFRLGSLSCWAHRLDRTESTRSSIFLEIHSNLSMAILKTYHVTISLSDNLPFALSTETSLICRCCVLYYYSRSLCFRSFILSKRSVSLHYSTKSLVHVNIFLSLVFGWCPHSPVTLASTPACHEIRSTLSKISEAGPLVKS